MLLQECVDLAGRGRVGDALPQARSLQVGIQRIGAQGVAVGCDGRATRAGPGRRVGRLELETGAGHRVGLGKGLAGAGKQREQGQQ